MEGKYFLDDNQTIDKMQSIRKPFEIISMMLNV